MDPTLLVVVGTFAYLIIGCISFIHLYMTNDHVDALDLAGCLIAWPLDLLASWRIK